MVIDKVTFEFSAGRKAIFMVPDVQTAPTEVDFACGALDMVTSLRLLDALVTAGAFLDPKVTQVNSFLVIDLVARNAGMYADGRPLPQRAEAAVNLSALVAVVLCLVAVEYLATVDTKASDILT